MDLPPKTHADVYHLEISFLNRLIFKCLLGWAQSSYEMKSCFFDEREIELTRMPCLVGKAENQLSRGFGKHFTFHHENLWKCGVHEDPPGQEICKHFPFIWHRDQCWGPPGLSESSHGFHLLYRRSPYKYSRSMHSKVSWWYFQLGQPWSAPAWREQSGWVDKGIKVSGQKVYFSHQLILIKFLLLSIMKKSSSYFHFNT